MLLLLHLPLKYEYVYNIKYQVLEKLGCSRKKWFLAHRALFEKVTYMKLKNEIATDL